MLRLRETPNRNSKLDHVVSRSRAAPAKEREGMPWGLQQTPVDRALQQNFPISSATTGTRYCVRMPHGTPISERTPSGTPEPYNAGHVARYGGVWLNSRR